MSSSEQTASGTESVPSGAERIAATFAAVRAEGRAAALMPYMMSGYPDLERSRQIAHAYVDGGADLIEFGIPFSDPLADGPVIHGAATAALAEGVGVEQALELMREVSGAVPVIVMCYVNPILAVGVERFAARLRELGACGVIVPDLPVVEAPEAVHAFAAEGLAMIPLVAPTTTAERMRSIGELASGFLYTVAVTGTTGERAAASDDVPALLARARANTTVPVALGFGIGTPEQAAAAAAAGADGVIVGSRLVRAAGEADPAAVRDLVAGFAQALREPGLH